MAIPMENRKPKADAVDARPEGDPTDLRAHFPEGVVEETPLGSLFTCTVPLDRIYRGAEQLTESYLAGLRAAGSLAPEDLGRLLAPLAEADPETTALIDAETCGFHGRPLFLMGLAQWRPEGFLLTQLFARNYAEEGALLARLADLLAGMRLLVSFNGKAFDWPFVRDRMAYHRLPRPREYAHVDLLHPSRRRWRAVLPNCKLQTLERYLSGRWRSGDIPGVEIPDRYHEYVRRQEARLISPIFHHNRLDLITMIELMVALMPREAEQHEGRKGTAG